MSEISSCVVTSFGFLELDSVIPARKHDAEDGVCANSGSVSRYRQNCEARTGRGGKLQRERFVVEACSSLTVPAFQVDFATKHVDPSDVKVMM